MRTDPDTSSTSNKRHIGYIENGINIDHIPQGNAWFVMRILNSFNSKNQIGVGLNLPSHKLGLKDLVKIENYVLSQSEIEAISLFCIGATLSVIKDFVVIDKQTLELPEQINNIIICPNKRCVSHQHLSRFTGFINRERATGVVCHYCEKEFLLSEIKNYKF